jgi:hypothetical protein
MLKDLNRDLFALPDGDKPTLLFATSGMFCCSNTSSISRKNL